MADILEIVAEILRINCSVVQCNYSNPLEGLFNLLFFPTVFIILLIYMLVNFILSRSHIGPVESNKVLWLLLSISLYAFIVFQDLYTMFVGLAQVWYFAVIILVGIFVILRMFFGWGGGGGSSSGKMPGVSIREKLGFENPTNLPFKIEEYKQRKIELEGRIKLLKKEREALSGDDVGRRKSTYDDKIGRMQDELERIELGLKELKKGRIPISGTA